MSIIDVQNLTRDYGYGKGIFDISISVDSGEIFGFLGPNGAGKTTTIRHLMGFIKPHSGSCKINGMDCFEKRDEVQKRLGYIPGEISFFDDMTGKDFLKFNLEYRKIKDDSRMEQYRAAAIGKALTEVVVLWFRNGMQESPEEMAEMLLKIIFINY